MDVGGRSSAGAEADVAGAPESPAVFLLDGQGWILGWSPGAAQVLGYEPAGIVGRHFSVFYLPEVAESGHPDWQLRRATEVGTATEEGWRLRRDGTRFWASAVITPHFDVEGSVSGFTVVTRDETRPHERLQRSDRRFRDLFAVSPVGIGVFDEAGWLLEANSALGHLLGQELAELYGRNATELLAPQEGGEAFLPHSAQAGHHRVPHRVLTRSDGDLVVCDLHITASEGDEGRLFWLVAFHDITERQQHAELLLYRATHDDLTGLANRRAALDLLDRLLDDPDAKNAAVLFCDIDHFKRINDALGHQAGDEVLAALARRLQAGLPQGCVPARQAGDEFLVVCPDVDTVGGVQSLAETVADLLHTRIPVQGQLLHVSASVGVATRGDTAGTSADLVRFADAAMFEAKIRGPGRIWTADEDLMVTTDRKLELENQLRKALPRQDLATYYQPIVTDEGTITAAEALVRWPHPTYGLLGPDVFLPVAKRIGLLHELDLWVLRTALREAATWPTHGGRAVDIAVNLAEFTPGEAYFVDTVTEILDSSGIDPARVILELTESALIDLPSRPQQAMRELTARGLRFAVDDFGTGYSSLSRLTELPVEIIKIDRQFVSGIHTHPSNHAVVHAVTEMARAMQRTCIAEGVETASEFRALSRYSVDSYQGWLFSPAIPPRELRALLDHSPGTIIDRAQADRPR